MPFSRIACDIQINVQLGRFKHTKKEVTVENSKVQTNGDSSQSWLSYSSGDPSDPMVKFAASSAET